MIDGVLVSRFEYKVDERGEVAELFRNDDRTLIPFGQVHMTSVRPGVVKAWHRHKERTDVLACVRGLVRLGLHDGRPGSRTEDQLNEFFLGINSPLRILIPPGVWFGLKAVGSEEALIVVLTDRAYDPHYPGEERSDPLLHDVAFDWECRFR